MAYDFWNNPLVVSAFRRKYRRSGPSQMLTLYPLTLLVFGMGVPYFRPDIVKDWPRVAFELLICLQTLVSGLAAAVGTSASMKSEVARQTLDFQRITSLSPRQILLGKLLGESAMAFLLVMSVFPLGFLCWIIAAFPAELLVLSFVNLSTHVLLSGSLGLVQPLELRDNKSSEGVAWIGSLPLGIPALIALGMALFPTPGVQYPILIGLLCFFPVAQVVIALVGFHVMERRLENPLNPALAKPLSYLLVLLIDLTALVFVHFGSGTFGQRWATLALVHLFATTTMIGNVTPVRETIRSWVWRYRGRIPRLLDSWVGNRSENGMAVLTYAFLGLLTLALELGVTIALGDREDIAPEGMMPVQAACLNVLLILVAGMSYQWFVFALGKKGASAFTGFVFIFVFVPLIAAGILSSMTGANRIYGPRDPLVDWLLSISPAPHFGQWLSRGDEKLCLAPLVLLYLGLLAAFWTVWRRSLARLEQEVDRKLAAMGVVTQLQPFQGQKAHDPSQNRSPWTGRPANPQ